MICVFIMRQEYTKAHRKLFMEKSGIEPATLGLQREMKDRVFCLYEWHIISKGR